MGSNTHSSKADPTSEPWNPACFQRPVTCMLRRADYIALVGKPLKYSLSLWLSVQYWHTQHPHATSSPAAGSQEENRAPAVPRRETLTDPDLQSGPIPLFQAHAHNSDIRPALCTVWWVDYGLARHNAFKEREQTGIWRLETLVQVARVTSRSEGACSAPPGRCRDGLSEEVPLSCTIILAGW